MYHRINTLADEERLLRQTLALQSSIRAKRERQRRKRTHDTEVYSQMLEPVTSSIAKLTTPNLGTTTAAAATAVKQEGSVKKEEEEEEEEDSKPDAGDSHDEYSTTEMTIKQEPDELYQEALAMIPRKLRDDGELGLCPRTHRIGDYTYSVHGNILQAVSNLDEEDEEEMHQFEIQSLNLWKLLLILNPNKIGLILRDQHRGGGGGGEYFPFVRDYVHIAYKLKLLKSYTGGRNRVKYTLLTEHHWGSGLGGGGGGGKLELGSGGRRGGGGGRFLFSSTPPTPRVIVLPPDNPGLLAELYRAVAELQAGNTTMRNLVVPMVREARRRKMHIPSDLLKNIPGGAGADDTTWVLA